MADQGAVRLQAYVQALKRTGRTWEAIGSTLRGWATNGVPENPQDGTLVKLDGFMGWERGSSKAVLDGGDPTPIDLSPLPPSKQERLKVLGEQLRDVADQLVRELERLE